MNISVYGVAHTVIAIRTII